MAASDKTELLAMTFIGPLLKGITGLGENGQSTIIMIAVNLTVAHWSFSWPHSTCSTCSTSSALITNNVVSRVTGVGSSHHEGGSRGCVH